MNDTDHFHAELDRLDSGLPDVPDLHRIRAVGARQRRRRRTAQGVAGGALALVLVAPAVLVAGGGGGDGAGGGRDGATDTPVAAAPAGPTDASFGDGLRGAVAAALPQAVERPGQERLGDRWVWRDSVNLDWEVGDPPRWDTLFGWAQHYEVDGASLSVVATREPASPTVDAAEAGWCREGLYVVERSCTAEEVDGRVVVVHEGTRVRGQAPDAWGVDVEVHGADGSARHASLTRVGVVTTGSSWAEARAQLPDVEDLVALAVDGRLVLPEPARYPRQFPPDRPQG